MEVVIKGEEAVVTVETAEEVEVVVKEVAADLEVDMGVATEGMGVDTEDMDTVGALEVKEEVPVADQVVDTAVMDMVDLVDRVDQVEPVDQVDLVDQEDLVDQAVTEVTGLTDTFTKAVDKDTAVVKEVDQETKEVATEAVMEGVMEEVTEAAMEDMAVMEAEAEVAAVGEVAAEEEAAVEVEVAAVAGVEVEATMDTVTEETKT